MTVWLAALAVVIWLYLVLGRGGFWRVREEPQPAAARSERRICVVIPARDEAGVIAEAVRSLFAQDYTGRLEVFVVDDHSSDGTAKVAEACGPVHLVHAEPLPAGWTGKLWALACGLKQAGALSPDYFLLTDADIVHDPGNVAALVARAEACGLDLVSLMVKLHCESWAERALIPAFLFFFLKLYPPRWSTGAAGGCILIRPSALARIGGIEAIRGELIDDCALAREVRRGGRIWMGVTSTTVSIRGYDTFAEIERMISRSAFTQLKHSGLLLAGTVLGLSITYLTPPLVTIFGPQPIARALGLLAWLLMSLAFLPSLRLYRRSPLWAPLLPAIAAFYLGATIHSALAYWSGRGGLWKGRLQDRAL